MSELETTVQRPRKVTRAIIVLIANTIIGILNFIITVTTTDIYDSSGTFLIVFSMIIGIALFIYLISQLGTGKKWARTIFLIFYAIAILSAPFTIVSTFKASIVVGILIVIAIVLQILALILLFSKESSDWYNLKKETANTTT